MNIIYFYRPKDPWGILSNFYVAPITIDGLVYRSTEHYFQAMKFEGTVYAEYIRNCNTPYQAAKEGRRRDFPLRTDWEQVKEQYMWKALCTKFTTIPECYYTLINTGNSILVEQTKKDKYWGDGGDGTGRNRLGILLMELRRQLCR
jgi:ribA/ribD-fused uncharacterized protein